MNKTGDLAVVGGSDGVSTVYSIARRETVEVLQGASGVINAAVFIDTQDSRQVAVATSSGEVIIYENGSAKHSFRDHAGAALSLSLHPCGDILLSVGDDKSFILYDISNSSMLTRLFLNSREYFLSICSQTED